MFKTNSFENELYKAMEKHLVANQVEDNHSFKKLAKAIDYLNNAADLFENAGLYTEAAEVVEILESFAGKKSKTKSSKSKPAKHKTKKPVKHLSLLENDESIEDITHPEAETVEYEFDSPIADIVVVEETPTSKFERPIMVTPEIEDTVGAFYPKTEIDEEGIKNILDALNRGKGPL